MTCPPTTIISFDGLGLPLVLIACVIAFAWVRAMRIKHKNWDGMS